MIFFSITYEITLKLNNFLNNNLCKKETSFWENTLKNIQVLILSLNKVARRFQKRSKFNNNRHIRTENMQMSQP